MPTYDFPVNRGRYITDFLEAWDRERRLRSDMATAEQMRQARELDLTRGRQAAEDELKDALRGRSYALVDSLMVTTKNVIKKYKARPAQEAREVAEQHVNIEVIDEKKETD